MNKIPCIKCTPELWEYIKPYLEKWGYSSDSLYIDIKNYPLLVINAFGNKGKYNLDGMSVCENYNRELITNVEEFLERAAKLKGFLYNRKDYMKFNGIEIKPEMVLVSSTETKYIVFPAKNYLATIIYGEAYSSWFTLEYILSSKDIVKVLDAPENRITDGKVLWQKPKEVVLTMDEIAEKFGYSVEQIKIKK